MKFTLYRAMLCYVKIIMQWSSIAVSFAKVLIEEGSGGGKYSSPSVQKPLSSVLASVVWK